MTYDPFYMKHNQVYKPEHFNGADEKVVLDNSAEMHQYYMSQTDAAQWDNREYAQINSNTSTSGKPVKERLPPCSVSDIAQGNGEDDCEGDRKYDEISSDAGKPLTGLRLIKEKVLERTSLEGGNQDMAATSLVKPKEKENTTKWLYTSNAYTDPNEEEEEDDKTQKQQQQQQQQEEEKAASVGLLEGASGGELGGEGESHLYDDPDKEVRTKRVPHSTCQICALFHRNKMPKTVYNLQPRIQTSMARYVDI